MAFAGQTQKMRYPDYMKVHMNKPKMVQKSALAAYAQSHQLAPMHMVEDMQLDQLVQNNNYMKLVFGGMPSENDNIDFAYKHASRQMAEAPVERGSLIQNASPLVFGDEDEEIGKDEILKTFAEQRNFFKGAVDSDTERFLKARPTHNQIVSTFYGKETGPNGVALRYNHVRGQNQLLPNTEGFRPQQNLSSKTFAPNENGELNPLFYVDSQEDPRRVPISSDSRQIIKAAPVTDLGLYVGNELDRYTKTDPLGEATPSFTEIFTQLKTRM